jgi:hypothetical protein
MKYLILIYLNTESRRVWEGLPETERVKGYAAHAALEEALARSGELIVTEALGDPSHAKTVVQREGRIVTTDGPFAETKEHLAGFYLVECENMERAIAVAAQLPEASVGAIEVRPVMNLSALDV